MPKEESRTRSALVLEALQQYLASARWQRLRRWGAETAERLGIRTEEDLQRLLDKVTTGPRRGGTPEAILALARAGVVELFVCPAIVAELRSGASLVKPSARISADFLVTGDKTHLRPLEAFAGVRIVTPREFLNHLAGGGGGSGL